MSSKDKPHGKFQFPVRHSHTIKEGEIIYWSDKQTNDKGDKVHFGEPKVILIKGLHNYPLNDFDGKYGMSNYSFGIPITSKKQGDDIVYAVNSDAFKEIINATKWSSGFTDHNMFRYFKPDFYTHFLGKPSSVLSETSKPKSIDLCTDVISPVVLNKKQPKKVKLTRKPKKVKGGNSKTKKYYFF